MRITMSIGGLLLSLLLTFPSCQKLERVNDTLTAAEQLNIADNFQVLIDSIQHVGDSHRFYWDQGKRIALSPQTDSKLILFPQNKSSELSKIFTKVDTQSQTFGKTFLEWASVSTPDPSLLNAEALLAELVRPTSATPSAVVFEGESFLDPQGKRLYLTPIVLVCLTKQSELKRLSVVLAKLNCQLLGTPQSMPDWYQINCLGSAYPPALIANALHHLPFVTGAYPYFISQ